MSALSRNPPPEYAKTSLAQIWRSDEADFAQRARVCVGGVKRRDGKRPMDEAMPRVREFNMHLQPVRGNSPPSKRYVA